MFQSLVSNIFLLFFSPSLVFTTMKGLSQKIPCPEQSLQLKLTLGGGQSFRWKEVGEKSWRGVFANKVWTLWNDNDYLHYKVESGIRNSSQASLDKNGLKCPTNDVTDEVLSQKVHDEVLLRQYLRLDAPLAKLYSEWSASDPAFASISEQFYGIRMLRQDIIENIFSFICSSNNNIIRISSMVEKLCSFYGDKIDKVDGVTYYTFPNVTALAKKSVEHKLRGAAFGYRAKFIQQSAAQISAQGVDEWLTNLQKLSYVDAKTELMKLPGIGAKVADCICLMSLNHLEAIPVDTHVFQIAQRYLPHISKNKALTTKVYNEIGDYFRSLYGVYAGWAHSILFCAELKQFRELTPTDKPTQKNSTKRPGCNIEKKDLAKKNSVKKLKQK